MPSSRIVGFGTSPAVPVLARGGGKSFTERARSKLEQLKHKTQEALQARKERQQREQQQQGTTSGSVQNESTRELTRAMRRETVSKVVASATSGKRGMEMPAKSAAGAVTVLATTHLLGNAFTNVSLGKVAVSFTHTVKALEPVFSVGLSALFLGTVPSLAVCASLVPIVVGMLANANFPKVT